MSIKMIEELQFRILFLLLYTFFGGFRIYYRRKKVEPPESQIEEVGAKKLAWGWEEIILSIGILGMLVSVIIYLIIPFTTLWFPLPFPSAVRWIGVLIGFSTLPFLVWVHRTLGYSYSAELQIKEKHKLVSSGPYSRIRHPMYTIFILFTLANILITANVFITFFGLIVIFIFYPISKKEEQMLINRFGHKYRDYMQRTGRFVPQVRRAKPQKNM